MTKEYLGENKNSNRGRSFVTLVEFSSWQELLDKYQTYLLHNILPDHGKDWEYLYLRDK